MPTSNEIANLAAFYLGACVDHMERWPREAPLCVGCAQDYEEFERLAKKADALAKKETEDRRARRDSK